MNWIVRAACITICAGAALISAPAAGAVTAEVAAEATKIEESLAKIARLYRTRKYRDAAALLADTEKAISTMALQLTDEERAEVGEQLAAWRRRSEAANRLLADKKTGGRDSGTSFSKDVAPLLVAHCAGCHIRQSRGGFSLVSYESLTRGSENGTVLSPGDGIGSRLFEVLDTGDMPRGGQRLPDEALATIRTWIDQGAKFDAADPAAAILGLVESSKSVATTGVSTPTGKETVSFGGDIAGIFVEHCSECHGGNAPRANLNLDSFTKLLAGSDAGQLFVPGKPDVSLLIGKLKGTAGGARMPMGRDPLPDATIAIVEKWIAEGATFDGSGAGMPTRQVWETALAAKLSADEMTTKRTEFAAEHWRLALPDMKPSTAESKSFYVVGSASEATLKEVAAAAESQRNKIAQALRVPRGVEWFKGRVTVFVFQRRVDYTEFAKMVEERGVPQEVHGHWRYSGLDPYACLVLPADETTSLRPLVAIQLAGLGISGLGDTPAWFSHGLARAIAGRVEGRDPVVRTWDAQMTGAMSAVQNAELFLGADASYGANSIAAYGVCRTILEDGRRFSRLLASLRDGEAFNAALTKAYGNDPQALIEAWAANAATGQ